MTPDSDPNQAKPLSQSLSRLRGISPNGISWARAIAGLPLAVLIVLPDEAFRLLAVALFLPAALSDWADGYFARRQNQVSLYGAWLDPVADKILVAAGLIALLGNGEIHGLHSLAVVAIVLREIYITALRAYTAMLPQSTAISHETQPLAVSRLAKWKTASQFIALFFLLVAPLTAGEAAHWITNLGLVLLWLSAYAALASGLDYHKKARQRTGFGK